jgi:hypothetical protein
MQHSGFCLTSGKCVCYVSVYKFGRPVNTVRVMMCVNMVWFIVLINIMQLVVLMCASGSCVY